MLSSLKIFCVDEQGPGAYPHYQQSLINAFKVISSAGNALEYSKAFAFIPKFFVNNEKVSQKFRQSYSKYVETG